MAFFPPGIPASKRIFDFLLSLIGLILISPVLLIIICLLLLLQKPPIFFHQQRPGYKGKPFSIIKFRTMTNAQTPNGGFLPDAERITRIGRFLRYTSLDELPELINVLKGDMSFVGPRPLLMQYLERYTQEQARRHEVLPGMAGWAQVNGRNAITWEDKFRYDVWYVDNWSFTLDLKIIGLTIWKVLKREGISQPGYVSAEEFMGTEQSSGKHMKDVVER